MKLGSDESRSFLCLNLPFSQMYSTQDFYFATILKGVLFSFFHPHTSLGVLECLPDFIMVLGEEKKKTSESQDVREQSPRYEKEEFFFFSFFFSA